MKIKTAMLLEALSKQEASAKRGANTTKNPVIKQCHEQEARELAALIAQIPAGSQELHIVEQEPAQPATTRR